MSEIKLDVINENIKKYIGRVDTKNVGDQTGCNKQKYKKYIGRADPKNVGCQTGYNGQELWGATDPMFLLILYRTNMYFGVFNWMKV